MPHKDPEARRAYYGAYAVANRERRNEQARTRRAASGENHGQRQAKWKAQNPTRYAYVMHRKGAKYRNIPFLLTFDEWLAIWGDKFALRGKSSDAYCMARYGDAGPYVVGNVRICTNRENLLEARLGKPHSAATRRKMSKPKSAETRERMSIAAKARWRAIHDTSGL